MPDDNNWSGEKLVFLFKFAALMNQIDFGRVAWFTISPNSFEHVLNVDENQIEKFAYLLT